ncbi:hypothetical protein [Roseivivax sp. CAU 1753]
MNRRAFLFGASALMLAPAAATAQTARDQVISQLQQQGYSDFRVTRTWLGRVRIVARGPAGRREVILNPANGVILRDYLDRDHDDDHDDDDDHSGRDDDDDRADDRDDNSGRGDRENDDDDDDRDEDEEDREDDDDSGHGKDGGEDDDDDDDDDDD